VSGMQPPTAPELQTRRLVLLPLRETDAREMLGVLADRDLYRFTGGGSPSLRDLEVRYLSQASGLSSGSDVWHNWILRLQESERAIGFVQATLTDETADVAWLVGTDWQGCGYAKEAAAEMCRWLRACGIGSLTAHIHPKHLASEGVAMAIGLQRSDEVDADGEIVWTSPET
jgi:RimJ/RimL family protein N-acetyltransferase